MKLVFTVLFVSCCLLTVWQTVKSKKATSKKVTPKAVAVNLKKEAMDFSLEIVKSYFSKDCTPFLKSASAEFLTFRQAYVLNDEMRDKLCKSIKQAATDSTKTFADYLKAYKTEMLTRAEIEKKAGQSLPAHYNSTDIEYYFVGFELKPGLPDQSPFITTRLFIFVVRKINGTWQVKGFLEE